MRFLSGEADFFVGRRGTLKRYLVCSMQGHFPVVVKTGPQKLAVIYRTGGSHVSIAATLAVSTSENGGKSWSDPVEIASRWEDVRNPAFGVNDKGELIAAYWKGKQCYDVIDGERKWVGWKAVAANTGNYTFVTISMDDGKSWNKPLPFGITGMKVVSPYGRIITAPDGTLLMSVYCSSDENAEQLFIIRSKDGGRTWGDETRVASDYNETSFVFLPDGTLAAAARHNGKDEFVSFMYSKDKGYTWSEPQQITRKAEHPADLTLLQSGKLLMTFGRRIRPMGCGALISEDGGKTWNMDKEILLAGDGINNLDLGYPSTVQLDDGTIVTALYYASGSQMSGFIHGWGDVSCQVIHYREEDII